jgi:hypothetical protein
MCARPAEPGPLRSVQAEARAAPARTVGRSASWGGPGGWGETGRIGGVDAEPRTIRACPNGQPRRPVTRAATHWQWHDAGRPKARALEPDANNPDGPATVPARRAPPWLRGLGQLTEDPSPMCARPAEPGPLTLGLGRVGGQFRLRPRRPGQSAGQQAGEGREVLGETDRTGRIDAEPRIIRACLSTQPRDGPSSHSVAQYPPPGVRRVCSEGRGQLRFPVPWPRPAPASAASST